MKKIFIATALLLATGYTNAQTDTSTQKVDTVRIGGMIIVKKDGQNGENGKDGKNNVSIQIGGGKSSRKNKKITTNWGTVDIGFNNFSDKTDYNSAATQAFTGNATPAFSENDFTLKNNSLNINVWIVRQRMGISKDNKFNFTWAVGIETNNYKFENNVSFIKSAAPQYVKRDEIEFKKNKLATSYLTVPLMLGYNAKPNRGGFTVNAGASIGYLYSSRNKQISDQRGKEKNKGNFNLVAWKLSLVGEIGWGSVKAYGSYTPKSIFKSGLDFQPYAVGIRLLGWD